MAVGVKDEECRVKGGECSREYHLLKIAARIITRMMIIALSRTFSTIYSNKKKVAPKTIIYPGTGTGVRSCCMLQRVAPLQKCTCNTDVFIACLFRMNKNKK